MYRKTSELITGDILFSSHKRNFQNKMLTYISDVRIHLIVMVELVVSSQKQFKAVISPTCTMSGTPDESNGQIN